ncbi:PREDICTED: uncharacterized protein LOC104591613 isoform X2 [Nelumbo nucifera]|uniref:Uncharacterized protein LOC104591613 isoform X2 n=1 Tax=Nelumbo nucifera TaxID=4432 RepID=A0A1U7Z6A0_NELNU|nr:PREDICTED: uncharacterized protein LOC104591613 isoform X2 [Nelumbo nucifera]
MGTRKIQDVFASDHDSPDSEVWRQYSKHRSCWVHLAASVHALPRRITRQEAEDIRRFEFTSPCFWDDFPHRERSKRVTSDKTTIPKQKRKLDTDMFERYLESLWRNLSEDKKTSFTYLDSLWFALYRGTTKTKVLMWIKKKNIFSWKYVFVPIVCWHHWSLLILCNLGENLQSKTRTPCMLLLDSLEMTDPKRLEPDIRKFLLDIYRSEGRPEKEELISKIPLLVPKMKQNWFNYQGFERFCKKVLSFCS